jgi:hypothetical protein
MDIDSLSATSFIRKMSLTDTPKNNELKKTMIKIRTTGRTKMTDFSILFSCFTTIKKRQDTIINKTDSILADAAIKKDRQQRSKERRYLFSLI